MAKTKSASKDAAKISKSSNPTEVKGISSVKAGAVTKPSQTPKSKSKEMAKGVAIKADKKSKKAKKEPTPSSSSDTSQSENEADSASPASSDNESETEASKPSKNGDAVNGNGIAKAAKPAADESESSDSSASSDDEDEPSVPVNGAKAAADDDSSEGSSEESDEEDAVPGAVDHVELNGKLEKIASKEASSDSDSEGSDASDSSEGSSGDEAEEEAPAPKKRKAETETTPVAKKSKTEASTGGDDVAHNNLFVGNLSWNIDEESLKEEFGKFGELTSVRIITDKDTGRSRGFGYVEFVDSAAGLKAQQELNGTDLDNRALNIDFANVKKDPKERSNQRQNKFGDQSTPPSDTLFVANIAFGANEDTLGQAFGEHGTVTSVRLPTDMESGQPKGYGYVQFGSIEDATKAMEGMSGAVIEGRPIRLDYAGPRPDRNGGGGGRGGYDRGGRGGGRGRGGFDRGGRGGDRGGRGRGGFDRGGRGGGRGGSTNRGGFGDFKGKKMTF